VSRTNLSQETCSESKTHLASPWGEGRKCAMKKVFAALPLVMMLIVPGGALAAGEATDEAMEEVVVTATRIETPAGQVASSVTVITADDIEKKHARTVLDVLRDVPGSSVTHQGGAGGASSVFLRGANSFHTLVLIDGVEANDPINPNRAFDFGHLSTDNIERIEVLRGPQSTLYGSDAIGGVINIITKRGGTKASSFLAVETGSFDTTRFSAGARGKSGPVVYSLAVSDFDSEGISSASADDGNTERDGYENITLSGRFDISPGRVWNLSVVTRIVNARSELDDFGGVGGDDPNFVEEVDQLFVRLEAAADFMDGRMENTFGVSMSRHERSDADSPDPLHSVDLNDSFFKGSIRKLDWQGNYFLNDSNTLVFGIESEVEHGKSEVNLDDPIFGSYTSTFDEEETTTGYFLEEQLEAGHGIYSTVGVRVDDHSRFGKETTWRIAPAVLFSDGRLKVKGTYGTGFKAPSLSQLLGFGGNVNLNPEKSTSWDMGVERKFSGKRTVLGATWFASDIEDMIIFSPSFILENINEAKITGLEITASADILHSVSVDGQYTHLNTLEKSTGDDLLRRADDQLSVNFAWTAAKGNMDIEYLYVGKREDMDFSTFPSSRVDLAAYRIVNISSSVIITDAVTLAGKLKNILDEDYEEVFGYGTPGVSGYVGVKVEL